MTLHLFLLFLSVFMGGMTFGVILIPNGINFLKRKFMTNGERAELRLEKQKKYDAKQVRNSEPFKTRLTSILKTIEDATKSGERKITVTSMKNCKTDREIRLALRERKFMVDFEYTEPNSVTIAWS